jgi:hypothetical protein
MNRISVRMLYFSGTLIKGQVAMADFYSILARAVSRLTTDNYQARQALYDHARMILDAQLGRQVPQLNAPDIIRERIALEMAIVRVDAESPCTRETGRVAFASYVPLEPNDKITEVPYNAVHEVNGHKESTSDDGSPGWFPDFASLLSEAAEVPPGLAQPEEMSAKIGPANSTKDWGGMPKFSNVALLSIAFIIAFAAIIYIRGLMTFFP